MDRHFQNIGNRLLEIDPTLIQFRLACRVLLSMACISLALAALHRFLPFSPAAYALGFVTTLQGTLTVRDETAWARAVTRVYSALAGFAVISLIAFLDHRLIAVTVILLGVIFLAVYTRRFGGRWHAVGMFTFFCCVLSGFLRPVDGELPGIAISLVLSSTISHLIRNFILPERPADDFRRAAHTVDNLVIQFEHQVRQHVASELPRQNLQDLSRIRHKARGSIQQTEGYLPLDAGGDIASVAGQLFDLGVAMDGCILALTGGPSARADLQARLSLLERIRIEIARHVAKIPDHLFSVPSPTAPPRRAASPLEDYQFRQAVQVTIASAIAMTGGILLSQERWFWAVITAFVVFTNTHSSGETLVRALGRTLGTAIGIVAGIVIATLVNGEFVLTVALTAIAIVTGVFFMKVSYTTLCISLSIAVSLIYGLIGSFTPHLLVLRLEETAIGAAAGIFVALWVLPTHTHDRLKDVFRYYIQCIDNLLSVLCETPSDEAATIKELRIIEGAQADLKTAIGPLRAAWNFGSRQINARNASLRVDAIQYSVEVLARTFAKAPPTSDQEERIGKIRREIAVLIASDFDLFASTPVLMSGDLLNNPNLTEADMALRRLMLILCQIEPADGKALSQ